ncbi:MAG: FAD-binding oxidoreductase [Acidimicrobiales bacterium]
MSRPVAPVAYPEVLAAAPGAGPAELLAELAERAITVETGARQRAEHARDWWPPSIPETSAGRVGRWPGAVARPRSSEEVAAVLAACARHHVALTPQGGRSGVVDGATPVTGGLALDLTALDRVLAIDPVSQLVRVEAGVFGPDLEAALEPHGLTTGHFPQSFEISTVGGWVSCRGAGQFSTRYGKVEQRVRGLRVALLDGRLVDLGGRGPHPATGPDLVGLFVGAEGTLGVITEVTLALTRRAGHRASAARLFDTFDEGLEACRRALQRGARPAVLRLYDEAESRRSFGLEGCALIVLDEGDEGLVQATLAIVDEECARAERLDESVVATWLERRNDVSALASLWGAGVVVDTIETVAPWRVLGPLAHSVRAALEAVPAMVLASVHQSHAYEDGACLYFTFAGRPDSDPRAFHRAAWDAALDAIVAAGAAVSHHHGVGRQRVAHQVRTSAAAHELLVGLKTLLDPEGLLNPGVLGLGREVR